MSGNREILESILTNVQHGQRTLRPILSKPMNAVLRRSLEAMMETYDAIEMHAYALASQRGWELGGLNPIRRLFPALVMRLRLRFGCTDSRIACMVQASSIHSRQMMRRICQFRADRDCQVRFLILKLLDSENANIRNMEPFL